MTDTSASKPDDRQAFGALAIRAEDRNVPRSDASKLSSGDIPWVTATPAKSGVATFATPAQTAWRLQIKHFKAREVPKPEPTFFSQPLLLKGFPHRELPVDRLEPPHKPESRRVPQLNAHRLLASARLQEDLGLLGQLTASLVKIGDDSQERKALQHWIRIEGPAWVRERRVALSAVIEAAVRLSLSEVATLIEQVLAEPNSPTLSAAVAAQRARRLVIADEPRRARMATNILEWIQMWEKSAPAKAALALPSLPFLMGSKSLEELSLRIELAPPLIAWGAATGLVDWLVERPRQLGADQATPLFDVIRGRIEREGTVPLPEATVAGHDAPDLIATLVLLLGHVATIEHIEVAASIIATAFCEPRGLEDATSVQAGRMLVERLHVPAMRALSAAFGSALPEFHRFATLLVSSR